MIDALLSSIQNTIAIYGPGPQKLIGGDMTAGFFGEVPVAELITGASLATQVGLSAGVERNSDEPWLKFAIDGKIVYYAKKSFRSAISRNSVSVAINKSITIGKNTFLVSLPGVRNPTPPAYSDLPDGPYTHNSEWNRLMYPITQATTEHPKNSQVGPNWAQYTAEELSMSPSTGNGVATWGLEMEGSSGLWRGNDGVSSISRSTPSLAYAGYGWRPRLELMV